MQCVIEYYGSLRDFHVKVRAILSWSEKAPAAQLNAAAKAAGYPFPSHLMEAALLDATYETAEAAGHGYLDWLQAGVLCNPKLIAEAIHLNAPDLSREAVDALRTTIMPMWRENGDGTLMTVPFDAPGPLVSLGQAALYRGCQVSVFDRAIQADLLYDGADALASFPGPLPDPVGVASSYKIAIKDGELHHPPLWPSDLHVAPDAETMSAHGPDF